MLKLIYLRSSVNKKVSIVMRFFVCFLVFFGAMEPVFSETLSQEGFSKNTESSPEPLAEEKNPLETEESPSLQEKMTHAISVRGQPKYPPHFTHFSCHNPKAPKGGTIRIPVIGSVFDTLNPFLPNSICAKGLGLYSYLTFDTLMEKSPDEPFSMYPRLAKGASLSPKKDRIIFDIDERARFHDGTPVEAEDVVFTFKTLEKNGSPARKMLSKKVKSVKALDRFTVEFLFHPTEEGVYDQELPLIIAGMPVLSKKALRGKDFSKTGLEPLMGSGPYRITNVNPSQMITYERVKDYWGKDLPSLKGTFNFNTIIYEYFGTDTVGFEAFKAGTIDHWTETNPGRWANEYTFPAAKDGRVLKEKMTFRNASIVTTLVFNTARSIFKNPLTRHALSLLIDLEWMNKNLFDHSLIRTDSFFGDTVFAAQEQITAEEVTLLESLPGFSSDSWKKLVVWPETDGSGSIRRQIEKAHQLLKEAGWHFHAGQWINTVGEPLVCQILLSDPKNEKLALSYQRTLAKAGITLVIQTVDSAQYQKRVDAREFDMILHTFGSSLSPGGEQKLYWLSAFAQIASRNYAGINSPAIDKVCDLLTSASDQSTVITTMRVLDRLLRQGYYMRPLYNKNEERIAYWNYLSHPKLNGLNLPSIYSYWHKK